LLELETISLPDIVKVLGPRPFGMNETMTEYLDELVQREEQDRIKKEKEQEDVSDDEKDKEENVDENKDDKVDEEKKK